MSKRVWREHYMSGSYLQVEDQNMYVENINTLPLLKARGLPTARSHILARNFVGIPFHHTLRNSGFFNTTLQSGTISFSQSCNESSIFLSLVNRRSCSALLRFSAGYL